MIKLIRLFFISIFSIAYVFVSYTYFVSEIYDFPDPEPFRGERLFNPYENQKGTWLKANFQAHTELAHGLTSGEQSASDVLKVYGDIGYDLIYVSDYHSINHALDTNKLNFIPIYEHGYSLTKTHRLIFGARQVSYFDIPLYFGISGKQYVINRLRAEARLIVLAHPAFMNGHTPSDLKYLSNYDLIEVANHFRNSSEHWDAALSAGKPVWLIANDDSHDLSSIEEVGRCWTMLNVDDPSAEEVYEALISGRTYGVQGWRGENMNSLKSLRVEGTKVTVEFEKPGEIGIIGDNGKQKIPVKYTDKLEYQFKPDDSYIRVEIVDRPTRSKIFLNPIIRYDGKTFPVNNFSAVFSPFQTYSMRLSIILSYLIFGLLIYGFFQNNFSSKKGKLISRAGAGGVAKEEPYRAKAD